MSNFKYLLFDMDGTLIDSEPGIIESLLYTFDQIGIKSIPVEVTRQFLGPPLKNSFMNLLNMDEQQALEAVKIYRQYYSDKGMYKATIYKEITELLEDLAGKYELFVATSKPTVYAEEILRHLGIEKFFKGVAGSNLDNSRGKKEEIIQYILNSNNITDLESVLMIGDKSHDIIGAYQCGIKALGVTYGYGTVEELRQQKPIKILNRPSEISKFLEENL